MGVVILNVNVKISIFGREALGATLIFRVPSPERHDRLLHRDLFLNLPFGAGALFSDSVPTGQQLGSSASSSGPPSLESGPDLENAQEGHAANEISV